MEPQEKPTRRKPESDMDRAVAVPSPSVFNLVGTIESFLLHLKSELDVEK